MAHTSRNEPAGIRARMPANGGFRTWRGCFAGYFLLLAAQFPPAIAGEKPPAAEIEKIRAGVLDAFEACHHWGGEEPYDEERAAQIRAGYERDCPAAFAEARAAFAALPEDPKVAAIIVDLEDYVGPHAFKDQRVVRDARTKQHLCVNAARFYADATNRDLRFSGYFEAFCPSEGAILPAR